MATQIRTFVQMIVRDHDATEEILQETDPFLGMRGCRLYSHPFSIIFHQLRGCHDGCGIGSNGRLFQFGNQRFNTINLACRPKSSHLYNPRHPCYLAND